MIIRMRMSMSMRSDGKEEDKGTEEERVFVDIITTWKKYRDAQCKHVRLRL